MTPALARRQAEFLDALFAEGEAASAGVSIYRRNVLANFHDALAAAYPVVRRLVGEAFFREAAQRYARRHGSRCGDLHRFGAALGDFLDAYPHAREVPCLGDVARLEWAVHEAGFAADDPVMDPASLASVPPERSGEVRFRLHASVRLVQSQHPVAAIWEANQPGRDAVPARLEGEDRVLVVRPLQQVAIHPIDPEAWRVLEAIAGGACLGDVLRALDTEAAALPRMLPHLAGLGAFSGFTLDTP